MQDDPGAPYKDAIAHGGGFLVQVRVWKGIPLFIVAPRIPASELLHQVLYNPDALFDRAQARRRGQSMTSPVFTIVFRPAALDKIDADMVTVHIPGIPDRAEDQNPTAYYFGKIRQVRACVREGLPGPPFRTGSLTGPKQRKNCVHSNPMLAARVAAPEHARRNGNAHRVARCTATDHGRVSGQHGCINGRGGEGAVR